MATVAFNYICFYKACPDPCHFEQDEQDVKNLTLILRNFLIYKSVISELAVPFHLLTELLKYIFF